MTELRKTETLSQVGPVLITLAAGAVLFIPAERLLDALFPGNHMGFSLMGVWFWIVLPASILLGVGIVLAHRSERIRGRRQAAHLKYLAWYLTGLLYVAATWLYRRSG